MMQPKKTKFRKAHKGRIHGTATSGAALSFGQFGLKAMAPERIRIRIFPDVPVSKKPAEVRMGSGKGTPELWVARVKPGRVLFEIDGVTVQTAKEALSLAAAKLPIKTRFVARIAE
jgi:large subunit ribosomal protein L16